jgi:RNA polymerase sigma-70 factor (ECF subfamily)
MSEPDDRRLLLAASLGDRGAFERFVQRHEAAVFRLLRTSAAGEADAEDALQEAFVAAWKGAGGYRGGASARGWILTIARNALSRSHRRRVGEPATFEPLDALGLEAGWGRDDALEGLARREVLDRAMGTLGEEEREVLVLRELEDLPGEEVAEMLGISVPAMKSRLHRARLRFLAALREVTDD